MAAFEFNFRTVTLLTTVEVVIALKFLPSPGSLTYPALYIFATNYLMLLLYHLIIQPSVISLLRTVPGPKVNGFLTRS